MEFLVPRRLTQVSQNTASLVSTETSWFPDNEKWKVCVKTLIYGSKSFKNFQKILEEIKVLSYGVFGLQNGIFGKFYWFFSFANVWKRLNTCRFYGAARWSVLITHSIIKNLENEYISRPCISGYQWITNGVLSNTPFVIKLYSMLRMEYWIIPHS